MGADKSEEINLTYETLFELVRREKNRPDLQKLEKEFFRDFVNYLAQKKSILKKEGEGSFFSDSEKQKIDQQVYNIRKLVKELYDRREKKIMDMAVIKAKTGSKVIEMNLTDTEKFLFDGICDVLQSNRKEILIPLLEGKMPQPKDLKMTTHVRTFEEESQNSDILANNDQKSDKTLKKVEFLTFVPEFVGLDLEDYGPFEEKDVFEVPEQIATLLIQKKVAKVVEE